MNSSQCSVTFTVVEPMLFRGPGEFGPYARGAQSTASTLNMPSPSTISGALATHILNMKLSAFQKFDIKDWWQQSLSVLGTDTRIRGPLLLIEDLVMTEDSLTGGFLRLDDVKEKCKKILSVMNYEIKSIEELDEIDLLEEQKIEPSYKSAKQERVGVGLTLRSTGVKAADEDRGLLYSAQYLDYLNKKKEANEIKEVNAKIVVDIKNNLIIPKTSQAPVNLGGEGRIVLLNVSEETVILRRIKENLWNNKDKHKGCVACCLATPALFKGGKSVKEQIAEWAKSWNAKVLGIHGRTDVLGAGFSMYHKIRKPIYISLQPGSVIFIEGDFILNELYWESSFGEASPLGYGTLLPVIID